MLHAPASWLSKRKENKNYADLRSRVENFVARSLFHEPSCLIPRRIRDGKYKEETRQERERKETTPNPLFPFRLARFFSISHWTSKPGDSRSFYIAVPYCCVNAVQKKWRREPEYCSLFNANIIESVRVDFLKIHTLLHVRWVPKIYMQLLNDSGMWYFSLLAIKSKLLTIIKYLSKLILILLLAITCNYTHIAI